METVFDGCRCRLGWLWARTVPLTLSLKVMSQGRMGMGRVCCSEVESSALNQLLRMLCAVNGAADGEADGDLLGASDAVTVGYELGDPDGRLDGDTEGLDDGNALGLTDGGFEKACSGFGRHTWQVGG
eukprot:scaffold2523_cov193-Skeletonema_menzelii.AAC.2